MLKSVQQNFSVRDTSGARNLYSIQDIRYKKLKILNQIDVKNIKIEAFAKQRCFLFKSFNYSSITKKN